MKRNITKFLAALALLVFTMPSLVAWGQTRTEVTDVMNQTWTGITGTTYSAFSDKAGSASDAVYSGNCAGDKSSIQLRSNNNNSGIVSTTSGGTVTKVTVTWQSDTQNDRTLNVYGKNTAYSAASDLYGNNAGTLIGTIVKGTSTELTITDSYAFIGLRSASGAMYLTEIDVTWETGGSTGPITYTVTYDANGGTGTMTDPDSPYEEDDEVTLLANTFEAPEDMVWSSWQVKDAENNDITVTNGTFTMPASDVTVKAQWVVDPNAPQYEWVLTDLANLSSSDVFVIVGNNGSNFAMANDGGTTSAPSAVAVTVTNNKITSTVANNIKWNISGDANNGYVFYPNGSTETWLYCTGDNNGVRVGTTSNSNYNKFKLQDNYIFNIGRTAYLGVYQSQDWRRYTSINANIQNQTFAFYKRQVVSTDPAIYASNVNIAYNDLEGEIEYTLENEVTGGELTASTTSDWLTLPQTFASPITFTATKNTMTEARTATVTLTYTYGNNQSISKDVTVTQGAHPTTYTTIEALFNAAGSTATEVFVTFGGWVVSGVSTNGYNVFVTDGTNGFVINGGDHGFVVGNTLTSTTPIACTLQKSNGYAKVTGVNASTEDLTVGTGGTVTVADIAMADLTGINTGALVHYENLTCSVSTNSSGTTTYYHLSDGTTSIQVYNALFAFEALEDGHTYNITGVYQQYSSTKEILPRSAEDIVEVEVQHEEYTLTIGNPDHITITANYDEEVLTNGEYAEVLDGTEVTFVVTVASGYVLESVTVVDANQEAVTFTETSGVYTFNMPASDVTINATATEYVAPTGDQYELFSGNLVEGDYLIVYDGGAMNHTVDGDRLQYEAVTASNDVIITDNAAIVWHIAPSGNYWTIYSADADAYAASTGAKNKAQMLADGTDDKALWTVSGTETYDFVNKQNAANSVNANLRKNGTYGFACYASSTGGALSLYKKVPTLDITGYGAATNTGGYVLVASPVTTTPVAAGMITANSDYDLYYFDDSQEDEWINYKAEDYEQNGTVNSFNLEPGTGYLYANSADVTLTFTGTPYNGQPIQLVQGWNLIGNPLGETAYLADGRDFYRMNAAGSGLIVNTDQDGGGNAISAMEGVFVNATAAGTITFSTTAPTNNGKGVALNVSKATRGASTIDRAIVRFDEGQQLPKFQLFENSTKLYIPQGNQDFAIVRSANEGEMPVSFKASENGTYTLAVETENMEMDYLHLIDNMTGMDVDLLQTPNYTFEASTRDYANRFRLVFKGNSANEQTAETFAYFNGTSWTVSNQGEATLQVVDVMGRLVSSETINGNATINLNETAGIYMLRLVNGNDVKVQKVVVR